MNLDRNSYPPFLLMSMYVIVILMQFQLDMRISQIPLRIGASDFFVPLFLAMMVYTSPTNIFQQQWKIKWLPLWFTIVSLWLSVSLLIGYLEAGFLSSWAFGNKFIGWFLLMGYFLSGGLTKRLTHEMLMRIFKVLFVSSWLIGLFCIFSWAIMLYTYFPALNIGSNANHRFIGFLQNPNAFGFFNAVLLLLYITINRQKLLFSPWLTRFGYTISLICIIGSGSRGAFITGIFGLVILTLYEIISPRTVFSIFMAGISILFGSFCLNYLFPTKFYSYIYSDPRFWKFSDGSVTERIHHIKLAFNWWLESPFMGIGLGSYLNRQIEQGMTQLSAIHQTPLWLLTETGLIGLILMLILIYATLKSLDQSSRFLSKNNTLAAGGCAIILACSLGSLASELMYQRYLWFFLGILLVKSIRNTQNVASVCEFAVNKSYNHP